MSDTVITAPATSTGAPQPPRGIMSKFRLDGYVPLIRPKTSAKNDSHPIMDHSKIVAVTGGM
jgi:hypothetical protein